MKGILLVTAVIWLLDSGIAVGWASDRQRIPDKVKKDWIVQDTGQTGKKIDKAAAEKVLKELRRGDAELERRFRELADAAADDERWGDLYLAAATARRAQRLEALTRLTDRIIFTKHFNMGGSHYAYTEALSDAQHQRYFSPGSALCLLTVKGADARVTTLLEDEEGVIRDPDISYDGRRILFAWKKSDREDDYHLYEMDIATRKVRALTEGLGWADYEGIYLPDGNIMFNSTRCMQIVDCWWTEVSNFYLCDEDGNYMRRIGFDQVHTNYPQVMDDGRVIYTRWDYNDRGQLYPQPLFQMNLDGTGQQEFYGNASWFPTTLMHARGIPNSSLVVAVASGHHTFQNGKLCIVDISRGRQEASGVQLIAPVRETRAVRVDRYGQEGPQWQYPYPLNEREFIVTFAPRGMNKGVGIYYMDIDGNRELLADDPGLPCNQPVLLRARKKPIVRPSRVDYRKTTGTYSVQDIYHGPGLAGIERGTVKKLRVVGLEFRAAGIGSNRNSGPAGDALVSTPVSIVNGAWDPKVILGEAKVYCDGSAFFEAPARTPLYFQAIDEKGQVVQSMRTWSTLMPGENFSCAGCHEEKNAAPPFSGPVVTMAMKAGSQKLEPWYGPPRGFSFQREIQPILDRHCIKCHDQRDRVIDRGEVRPAGARIPTVASHAHSSEGPAAASDGLEPKDSNDHDIARHTWWPHKGTREWIEYDFKKPRWVTGISVYWFDDEPRGGKCRVPQSWRLLYAVDGDWRPVPGIKAFPTSKDRYCDLDFQGVVTTGLRIEVQLQKDVSGGILEWKVAGAGAMDSPSLQVDAPEREGRVKKAFSLLGLPAKGVGQGARRKWSDAYVALTVNRRMVNWLNVQSVPQLLPPYHAGSSRSGLLTMLREGHSGVELSREEMEKIACWIDLLVPFCGDYLEANSWNEEEYEKYMHFQRKREDMAEIEYRNIEALIEKRTGRAFKLDRPERFTPTK